MNAVVKRVILNMDFKSVIVMLKNSFEVLFDLELLFFLTKELAEPRMLRTKTKVGQD